MLTLGQVKETLPVNFRNNMTQDMVDQLNSLSKDPEEARYMRENFVSFASVLQEGRFKVGDYVKAVMYVSYKVMSKSNHDAYKLTFPERYAPMEAAGKSQKDIASIISAYNRGQLVTLVTERAIVPTWLLNQDKFQSALQTQYELMSDTQVSDKVRCDAANSLLTHLAKPTVHKAELKIEVAVSDGMAAMEAQLVEMSRLQLNMIEHDPNISANDIAALPMKVINPDD